jgi:hypothetical protein
MCHAELTVVDERRARIGVNAELLRLGADAIGARRLFCFVEHRQ